VIEHLLAFTDQYGQRAADVEHHEMQEILVAKFKAFFLDLLRKVAPDLAKFKHLEHYVQGALAYRAGGAIG